MINNPLKYSRPIFLSALAIVFLFSCLDTKDQKLLVGKWTGTEWLVNNAPASYNPENASFIFGDDARYSFTYAGSTESGKYFLSNNELFTTPEGGIKMMVKVVKLNDDTLVIDMNRGGQPERLTLLRTNDN